MSSPFSPVPLDTEAAVRDFQDRVGRLARLVLVMAGVTGAVSIVTHAGSSVHAAESGGILHEIFHGVLLVPPLVVWLPCRGRTLSPRVVGALDVGITVVACGLITLLGTSATSSLSVAFSVVLAMSYTLVGRSILVPSSFTRTLWISAVSALPTLAYLVLAVPRGLGQTPESARIFSAFGALWCLFAVLTAAVNSRQLFGLRAQIREIGKLGQYTLEDKIGEGGMGVVFRARHALLRRPAAIKLLSKERASERDQLRFEREVQLTSRLAHPNTVSIFDYGRSADGVFYYVMEYLDGFDLNRLVEAEGPLAPARVIHILSQVCGALGEAHALGLVHRDIKPANIVLTERIDEPDVVKVVDFGLAKTLEQNDGDTLAGAVLGTPLYLAPEAINDAGSVDGRADIYALGAVAFFLLTGQNVFQGRTVVELLGKHLLEAPTAPSSRGVRPVPRDLDELVLCCLSKDRDRRPASADALKAALLACEDAARYDRRAALDWWRGRGATLRAAAHGAPVALDATMAIDFASRAAAHD